MLHDDSFQQRRRDTRVPHAIGVDDDDGAAGAHAKAGRLTALDPCWAEQQIFALEQLRQQTIELPAAPIGRTEAPRTHQDVALIRFHARLTDIEAGHSDVLVYGARNSTEPRAGPLPRAARRHRSCLYLP